MLTAMDFFDLSHTEHADLFENTEYVWEAINQIGSYIKSRFDNGLQSNGHAFDAHPSTVIGNSNIFIGEGTHIAPGVYIEGPAIIGENCEIRQGAYIRANIVLSEGVVVGHTTELKNSVLLNDAHAPHFAYVGDSILGSRVNLGAGSRLSNFGINAAKDKEGQRPTVVLDINGQKVDTGLVKIGAILGDDVQLGCNCVTNPGTLVGPRTLVYPLISLRKGVYPSDSIIKLRQQHEIVRRR